MLINQPLQLRLKLRLLSLGLCPKLRDCTLQLLSRHEKAIFHRVLKVLVYFRNVFPDRFTGNRTFVTQFSLDGWRLQLHEFQRTPTAYERAVKGRLPALERFLGEIVLQDVAAFRQSPQPAAASTAELETALRSQKSQK